MKLVERADWNEYHELIESQDYPNSQRVLRLGQLPIGYSRQNIDRFFQCIFLISTSFFTIKTNSFFRFPDLFIENVIWLDTIGQANKKDAFVIFESASVIDTALAMLNAIQFTVAQ